MKAVFCGIILLLSFGDVNAQRKSTVTLKVNEQVELMSIVARLAGYGEFVNNNFKTYSGDVDEHFGKYKNHELIKFAQKIRQTNNIGFERVMAMAAHLRPDLNAKIPFTETVPNKSWGIRTSGEFVRLLKKFYKDADCGKFFASHAERYRTIEQRYQKIVDEIDLKWFGKFYGEHSKGNFFVYIGLLNGGGNYNASVIYPEGRKDVFAVVAAATDMNGQPVFTEEAIPTIIHEFSHSFVNHLVDENPKPFESNCEAIYKLVAEKMSRLAYRSWQTALIESLVRVGVVRYLFEHYGIERANRKIVEEKANGFVWMDELSVLLGTYENDRKTHPTLRSFMPLLASYHSDLAKRVEDRIEKFEASKSKMLAIEEFKNGAQDVDADIKQITFIFEESMTGKGSADYGKAGVKAFPEIVKITGFNEDQTKFTMQVKLKPDWGYEFIVTGRDFISKDGYPLRDFIVRFKTK